MDQWPNAGARRLMPRRLDLIALFGGAPVSRDSAMMRPCLRIAVLVLALAACAGAARAGSLIEFANLAGRGPDRLLGYLARPDTGLSAVLASRSNGAERYAAVVVLHGCSGISSHSAQIADRLGSWGYVALLVDSLAPRGIAGDCLSGGVSIDQAFDAYAALRYLSRLDFVDPARIAVLGQSLGGSAVLYAIDRDLAAQYFQERFHAAIAYYPNCGTPALLMTAPLLILIGAEDESNAGDRCRKMVAHARPDSAPVALTVYPGAHHAFDVAQLKQGVHFREHWLEYDESAAKDAEAKVRAFLAANIGSAAPGKPAGQ